MKYLLTLLFLNGCCSYDREHAADMFASGARNYCSHLYVKNLIDHDYKGSEPDCEKVYNEFYRSNK